MPKTTFRFTCLWIAAFLPFGLFAQVDPVIKPYRSGYVFDKYNVAFNIYGNIVFGKHLLDTTYLAKDIVKTSNQNWKEVRANWLLFDSFWKEEERIENIHSLLQFPILHIDWDRYPKKTVNKKDLKALHHVAERMFLHPTENGAHINDLIKENRFTNSSGTAFLTLILNNFGWPFEIRRYEDHLYIVILGTDEHYILDCMHLAQIWKIGKDDKKYLKVLENESFKDRPASISSFLDLSTTISFRELVSLQKLSESEQLKKTDLYSAIERLEVAYYFWPQDETLENLKETCWTLFNSNDKENNWGKLYAAIKYIQITQDTSQLTKSQFNLLLGNSLLYYSTNEEKSLGHPPASCIRIKGTYLSQEIPIQDTFNLIGSFDFDQYVGFPLTDERNYGFFHSLRYASSIESSGGSDYQFYIDALYIYFYLEHSKSFLQSICAIPISNYDYFDSMPYDLLSHLKGGVIDSSQYHEMCALFYFTHLLNDAPENISEASIINMESLIYSHHLGSLANELKYIDNPDLIAQIKQYVLTVSPIFSQKLVPVEMKALKTIGGFCGVE